MSVQVEKEIVMRPLSTIRPYVRNPRNNSKTVDALVKIIPKVGFNVPIVIDEKGIIVKGHARFAAAIRLEMSEVPCIITHADEEAVKADRITDNKISEFSEWITAELMEEINDMDFDLSDLGLPKINLDQMFQDTSTSTFSEIAGAETAATQQPSEQPMAQTPFGLNSGADIAYSGNGAYSGSGSSGSSDSDSFADEPYYRAVCDKCGYVMILKEGDLQ